MHLPASPPRIPLDDSRNDFMIYNFHALVSSMQHQRDAGSVQAVTSSEGGSSGWAAVTLCGTTTDQVAFSQNGVSLRSASVCSKYLVT
jgi:hypothetical protein